MEKDSNTTTTTARKIPPKFENPIDSVLIDWSDTLSPFLHSNSITANQITITGNFLRVIALYHLFYGSKVIFLLLAIVSYFLDVLDGYYARKYNQCSILGDYLDHYGDVVFGAFLLVYLLYFSTMKDSPNFLMLVGVLGVLTALLLSHLGCIESYYESKGNKPSESFKFLQCLCYDYDQMKYTRYFSSATVVLIVYLLSFVY